MKIDHNHILIGAVVIIGLVVLFLMFKHKPVHNVGVVEEHLVAPKNVNVNSVIDDLTNDENKVHPIDAANQPVSAETINKLQWKNSSKNGKYANSSYADGERGNNAMSEWEDFYKTNTDMLDKSYVQNNDAFIPVDETSGNLASYDGKGHVKMSAEELFKVDNLLPQEVSKDWFEVVESPISIKNRHLIPVAHSIGVSSIGASSKKNTSLDLRGDLPVPKTGLFNINMSSITPNLLTKGLCNY